MEINQEKNSGQNVQALAPAVAETALQNSERTPVATDGCQQRLVLLFGAVSFAYLLWAMSFNQETSQIQEQFQSLLGSYKGWFVGYLLSSGILLAATLNNLLAFLLGALNKRKRQR